MLKKLIVFTLIFGSLGLSSLGNVSAVESSDHNVVASGMVTPRAALCSCGSYFRPAGTHYTSWTRTGGKRWCKDGYPWGDDLEESRKKIQEYRCENCGIGYDSQTTEYGWICYGHR